jgi:carbamoyl-phosphate synthase large subunit
MYYGMAKITRLQANPQLEEYSRLISEKLSLNHINNIAYKQDEQGAFKVLEINPRVPGTIIATLYAGVNFAGMVLDSLYGRPLSSFRQKRNERILLSRYWNEAVIPPGG